MKVLLGLILALVIVVGGMYLFTAEKTPKSDTIVPEVLEVTPFVTPLPTSITMKKFEKLLIEDTVVGTGSAVKSGDTISIHYLGTLTDGTKFDSSYDRGAPFETQIGVGRVIKGWDEGVIGMQVGGKRTLSIPSDMGYGLRGAPPTIPPNADLIFEVELMEIK